MFMFLHSRRNWLFTSHGNSTQIFKTTEKGLDNALWAFPSRKPQAVQYIFRQCLLYSHNDIKFQFSDFFFCIKTVKNFFYVFNKIAVAAKPFLKTALIAKLKKKIHFPSNGQFANKNKTFV